MPSKTIEVKLPSGIVGATLFLCQRGANIVLNIGGDTLTEKTVDLGTYLATVSESMSGNLNAHIKLSGSVIAVGQITGMSDDSGTYTVGDGNATELAALALGGLTGPSSVTLTFVDADSDPVPFVDFTIVGMGIGRSDENGVATFGLPNGTYTVVARAAGVLFENDTLVVSGATPRTITGSSAWSPAEPSSPDLTMIAGHLRDIATNELMEGVLLTATLIGRGPAYAGGILSGIPREHSATSDGDGLVQLEVPKGFTYRIVCEQAQLDTKQLLENPTFDLDAYAQGTT